jgi:hypothetical protein
MNIKINIAGPIEFTGVRFKDVSINDKLSIVIFVLCFYLCKKHLAITFEK